MTQSGGGLIVRPMVCVLPRVPLGSALESSTWLGLAILSDSVVKGIRVCSGSGLNDLIGDCLGGI